MEWNFDPVLIEFSRNFKIHYYGVIFALGIFIGYLLWRWQMTRQGHSEKDTEDFVLWGFLAVILGARLGHCLFYEPGYYLKNPLEILFFWKGGLASHGAAIALVLTLYFYHRVKKIPLLDVCDCFSMSAAVGAIAVRIGNFLNSEIVGRVTNVPWAVKFVQFEKYPLPRHPSQLYEVALGLIVLGVLYFTDHHYGTKRPKGILAALFLICYFTGRFFVEYFKEYQVLPSSFPFTMGQLLSVPFVIAGSILLYKVLRNPIVQPTPVAKVEGPSKPKRSSNKKR